MAVAVGAGLLSYAPSTGRRGTGSINTSPEPAAVSAGGNGNLSWNVPQRLDQIIARHPDMVPGVFGINDVQATYRARMTGI